jgi:Type II secretion system (T2SS), protein M subtype b
MSPREKNLLLFFAVAGFIVLNFFAIRFYREQRQKVDSAETLARQQLETAQNFSASRELVTDQMDWLSQHEPPAAANQDVQTQLQQIVEREAKASSLVIKSQKPLPTDATAERNYHRAKLQITVNGTEQALYQWFDRLNSPEQLRIASRINLKPNDQDDTKIDCTATVEQWFVPAPTL